MDIGIFIEHGNMVVQIPVNPEKFTVSTGGNNSTVDIIALGEVVIPRTPKLSSISWESFFPYESWSPMIRTAGKFESADFYLDLLEELREECKPFHLTVTGIGFDDDVVIESFDYYHQAGDHEDTYYSITLKKYQPYSVTVVSKEDIENDLNKDNPSDDSSGKTPPSTTVNPTDITIGCEVYLNGRVHKDSYGSKPGKTYTNYKCKVSLINKKGSHPYHVVTPSGSALGWVTKKSLSFSKVAVKKKKKTKPKVKVYENDEWYRESGWTGRYTK